MPRGAGGAAGGTPPQPSQLERWVSDGGWLVDLLLPRTDAGVLAQAVVVIAVLALLLRPALQARLLPLWLGSGMFIAGLFALRASH
jgi:hypothetical protein